MTGRALVLLLLLAVPVFAEDPVSPPRLSQPADIDGHLDEEIWKEAHVVKDFVQRLPKEGGSPTEETEMRIFYTPTALYLGFRAFDRSADKIVATVFKRDDFDVTQNDQLALAIDSYNDGRNGYWFSTNPLGARVDAQFANEGDLWEANWNGIWNCKTRIDDGGWTAEIEIPFSTLRFARAEANIMGINFYRRLIRTNEHLFAPLIPLQLANGTPNVSAARKFRFTGIHGADHLFVKPYGLSGFSTESNHDELERNAGIDARYQLTNSLITNFALNMDFAQADVDDRQINLTRFALFFPEKRDFFLESANHFQFGIPGEMELFFSRRIGLSEDSSETVPILFGGKMTGKIGRFDIGFLDVHTKSKDCLSEEDPDCSAFPSENFSVFRFRSGIKARSYVGGILTNRLTNGNSSRQTYGLDMNLHLHNEIFLSGFASGIHGASDSSAYDLQLWRGGNRMSFQLRYTDVGTNFDPAIGFVQRPDTRRFLGSLYLPYYRKSGGLLSWTPGYSLTREEDHGGILTFLRQEGSFRLLFQTEDQIKFFGRQEEELVQQPFTIFRDIEVPAGRYNETRGGFELSTKPGRRFSATLLLSHGGFFGGNRFEASPTLLWKMNKHLTVSQTFASNAIDLGPEGFHVLLTRTRIAYSLNTNFSAQAMLQYDNSSQKLGLNFRAGYLFKEGTELFVVYNEILDQTSADGITPLTDRSLVVKFTYMLSL